jgi:hypothetical protein
MKQNGDQAPQNLINPGNKHSLIKGNEALWNDFKQGIQTLIPNNPLNRTSEEYNQMGKNNFVNIKDESVIANE